eukprot:EG_transcript_13349
MYVPRFHPYAGSPWQGRARTAARPPVRPPVSAAAVRSRVAPPLPGRGLSTAVPSVPQATFASLPKPTVASAVTIAPAVAPALTPDAPNPKAKLNEWMQKVGHQMAYTTVACEGGFSSTIVLPLDGAGEAATCVGVATSKKMAETRAADQAMQTLMNFGLLDVLRQPSKNTKKPKAAPVASPALHAVANGAGAPAAAAAPVGGVEDFAALKQSVHQHVIQHPGKRTTVYMMMCPAGERRKRVTAALYQLAQEGLLVKHEPTGGRNMTPFWAPVGYQGTFGGGVSEEELGPGRTLPLTEVKMVCYDILMAVPSLTAREVLDQLMALGHAWDLKTVNAALYAMEKDGTVVSVLEATTLGVTKRWNVK